MSDENPESIVIENGDEETSSNSPAETPVRLLASTINATSTPTNQTLASVRTNERLSFFSNGVPSNLDEIRPIIAQAYSNPISLTSWLNMNLPRYQIPTLNNFVMNMEDSRLAAATTTTAAASNNVTANQQNATTNDTIINNIFELSSSENSSNNNNESSSNNNNSSINNSSTNSSNSTSNISNNNLEDGNTLETISSESNAFLRCVENHWPFAAIMTIKFATDNHSGTLRLFEFIILLFVFVKMNNDLKREIFKQQNCSFKTLLHIIIYTVGALITIYFIPNRGPIFYIGETTGFWNLLWSVIITDFILKLFTILLKTLITFIPDKVLVISKRGKYYLAIEATSQFVRCIAPMNSWMVYLMNSVPKPDIWGGYILMILYGACKIPELSRKWKYLQNALVKFCQNVSLGTSPSKEQLTASGGICVICHEEFSSPVRLHCNHIFCENCVSTWLNREKTCPLCRTAIIDDPTYRDGDTTHCIQFY